MADRDYQARYRRLLAPRTGDLRLDMASEAAEFLGIPVEECLNRMDGGQRRFTEEWEAKGVAAGDPREVTRFYSESETELFDLLQWHATDAGNHRAVVCSDIASENGGHRFLDYGSGVGTIGLVFAAAGFDVTLADVADPLLRFARWRFERRGLAVRTCDLKREELPSGTFDAVVCFDVLEHILRPARTVADIARTMRPGGLFFLNAPFGFDPRRPMHVVYDDGVIRRMRAIGYRREWAAEAVFPHDLGAAQPRVYRRTLEPAAMRAGFYVKDALMPARVGELLSKVVTSARRATRGGQ